MDRDSHKTRYGIVVNPAAGRTTADRKRLLIAEAASCFGSDTIVDGWDTESSQELGECAAAVARKVDILVVAGGDGTVSDVVNAIDDGVLLAYLPMGSGNALRKTLGLCRSLQKNIRRIRNGSVHAIDLVLCDGKRKGFVASLGIDGHVLKKRENTLRTRKGGIVSYLTPLLSSLLWEYDRTDMEVIVDGHPCRLDNALTVVITKTPFYGYGFKVVPEAQIDDGELHVLLVNAGRAKALLGIIAAILCGNRIGRYRTGKTVRVVTRDPVFLQIDGNVVHSGREFVFEILPGALRLQY